MAEESKQRVHILRLFGMEQAALVRILREAAAQGCPGLRLLEQGGEQAVCVRARSQSPEDLDLAAQWADELEKLLGPISPYATLYYDSVNVAGSAKVTGFTTDPNG